MAAYLKFHQLKASPFDPSSGNRFVLATEALRRAYAEIRKGLDEGSPRICLSGGPGIGKSSLAAALPKLLESGFHSVLLRDPSVPWERLKAAIVRQLDLPGGLLSRSTLDQSCAPGRPLVLIFDQAEKLDAESLAHLDVILGYKSESGSQLVHLVLLANLEAAPRGLDVPLLWWLDQLTTLQLRFSPIPSDGIRAYVDKHLRKAGWNGASLFTDEAITAIHRYTGGIPGTVGALCEELLAKAAQRRVKEIDADLVHAKFEPKFESNSGRESNDEGHPERFDPFEPLARAAIEAPRAAEDSLEDTLGSSFERGFDRRVDDLRQPSQAASTSRALARESEDEAVAWPQLGPPAGERADTPSPAHRDTARRTPLAREPEMKIEQGFVPMDDPVRRESEIDDFHVRSRGAPWGSPPHGRSSATREPSRRGISKTVMWFAVISLATAAAWVYWPANAPIPRPKLRVMIPPPVPAAREEAALGAEQDIGLTSDLRVPDTSATKPRTSAKAPAEESEAGAGPNTAQLIEPWAAQEP